MSKKTEKFVNAITDVMRSKKIIKDGIKESDLTRRIEFAKKSNAADFSEALLSLIKSGVVTEHGGRLYPAASGYPAVTYAEPEKETYSPPKTRHYGVIKAQIDGINGTYGFAVSCDDNATRYFIPGKFLGGAMPGDLVLMKILPPRDITRPEGEIKEVIKESDNLLTGTVENFGGYAYIRPDCMPNEKMSVVEITDGEVYEGDKVGFKISRRGRRHSDHEAVVTEIFGDSECAESSAFAAVKLNGIEIEFPEDVLKEAEAVSAIGIPEEEKLRRLDLRKRVIFTIDGEDTKDIDDAISVRKTDNGYELGVHIADVSFYVKPDSALDKDAFNRGTSVYFADKVIPMLPKALSNGICSLNPNEDRLAFSCLMRITADGKLGLFKFSKSVIRSRVKGVYSEINKIINAKQNNTEIPLELRQKYDGLTDTIMLAQELAEILTANRLKRGAPEIISSEGKYICDEDGVCIDVKRREQGLSELLIEEFMLMANTAAARLARERDVPFVYRVHDKPPADKIKELWAFLIKVGINPPKIGEGEIPKPKHLAKIIASQKGKPLALAVNMMVLRSMAKAKYADVPLGHYGLSLDDYAHFTSPIRRYPDLAIHRILTDLCYNKLPEDKIAKRYRNYVNAASKRSSEAEISAMKTERTAEDFYAAEFMLQNVGNTYEATVTGVMRGGFFVQLQNTVEGFVSIDSMPERGYDYDGMISLSKNGKAVVTVGDVVEVQCVKADVASARIDFILY
ncbi:MAG: ribonuclease R [Ruminococcus sp.]|jgi:ribonuclease R|nr:ribonuclease R [Ruminococcus sp.]